MFAQFRASDIGGAAFGAAARPLPVELHVVRHESFDGVGHVREPGAAAELAVGKNVDAELTLLFERSGDGAVFLFPKVFERELSLSVRRASFQEFRRTQQASDLFGAIDGGHELSFGVF